MPRPLPVWHLRPPQPSSRLLVFQGGRLVDPPDNTEGGTFSRRQAESLGNFDAEPLLVASWQGEDIYAVELPETSAEPVPGRTLRQILTTASADFGALCSSALQLLHWQRDNRFCGRCGQGSRLLEQERARYCDHCRHRLFPRLSPCVIVAIQRGDKVLLAQSHRAASQFYSLIAGFVEPGESAEEAVHREVAEETGLEVTNVRYMESQSWPFPHQLMLGYLAEYKSGELVLEKAELVDGNWFQADDLPAIPGEWTIAGKLIRYALERSA